MSDQEKTNISQSSIKDIIRSDESLSSIDPTADKRLLRKCDLHILPVLMLLYLMSFMDRINIGNAKLQGLEKDLNMFGNDYNIALFVFFIPYILCEVPSNLILKKVASSSWISGIMFAWGVITICQGVTKSFGGLVACRFLLGVFEAGFVPGCMYFISMYYKRYELQWRMNLFFSSSIMAGAVSGLLAYAIANNMAGIIIGGGGAGGYNNGWRWIFIIEGLATVVIAIVAKFLIPDWPESAKFLDEEERALLIRRLASDHGGGVAIMNRLDKSAARRVFSDVKIYLGTIMYLGVLNTGYSTSFFTPTILKQLGWTSVRAQVMSIPIYISATITSLCSALASDKLHHRFLFTILGCIIATIGYSILLCQVSVPVGVRYFAIYAITAGGYMTQPIVMGWLSNNVSGHYKRSIASGVQIGFGNCGGLIASNVYLAGEAPTYRTGFGVSLGLVWVSGFACVVFFLYVFRENRLRGQGKRDYRYGLPKEELENLGDDHPSFRFAY
ncbi:hypothetical protein DTO063F5_1935 [Paecilomyces variotii]|nr:hypothetical protein DTO063F5_1935 [Paecilomyces variotii]